MRGKVIEIGTVSTVLLIIVALLLIQTAPPESEVSEIPTTSVFGFSYNSHWQLTGVLSLLGFAWIVVLIVWDSFSNPSIPEETGVDGENFGKVKGNVKEVLR